MSSDRIRTCVTYLELIIPRSFYLFTVLIKPVYVISRQLIPNNAIFCFLEQHSSCDVEEEDDGDSSVFWIIPEVFLRVLHA